MSQRPILKYSDILGSWFYNISLSQADCELADIYFFGAAHHFYRWKQALHTSFEEFHLSRHRAHLRHLVDLVYRRGDFTKAYDPSFMDLDLRESWDPEMLPMPHPEMFNSQSADERFQLGRPHGFDVYLTSLKPNAIQKVVCSGSQFVTENGVRIAIQNV
jgi:hypothetical protein